MAINISQAFRRTSANPVDESLTLTKAQMLTVNDNLMPSKYFTVCQDDGKIYLYDKTNTVDPATGKFRVFEGGGSGGASNLADLEDVLLTTLADGQTLVWDSENSKWVNSDIPTVPTKTSDLINDSGFITKFVDNLVNYYLKTETYSKSEVDSIVTAIKNSRFEAVLTLPTTDIKTNVIYLVPSSDPKTSDVKDEYINLDGTTAGWEKIGSTDIDLSNYVTITALNTALANYTTTTELTALLADKADNSEVAKAYKTDDASITGADLAEQDLFPLYDASANAKKNILWQHIVGVLTSLYQGIDDKMTASDMDEIFSTLPSTQKSGHNYSTAEHVVGTWIDGSTIYEKTINFGALPNKNTKQVAHDISNLKRVVNLWGHAYSSSATSQFTLPYNAIDTQYSISVSYTATYITVITGSDRTNFTESYITIQYTKS